MITILYPLCPSYSGSTLLSLLLGNQKGIYGAGELFIFSKHPSRVDALQKGRCSCNKLAYSSCPFWEKIERYLTEHYQLTLKTLSVESENEEELILHNKALFQAIQSVSGCSIIIDSSKIVSRFVQLRKAGFHIIPIRLFRKPQAVVHSWTKRDHDWWDVAHYYPSFYKAVAQSVADRNMLTMRYEKLANQPKVMVQKILDFIGLHDVVIDLDWAKKPYHHLKGNPMRFHKNSKIKVSEEWQSEVPLSQRFWIALLAFPVKVDRYWFYYFWERFVVLFTWKRY